ncbi:alpha/beta hydrolase-fold protein [Ferruginibacter sp.]|nr:alpha/beta hydrolase [Ferruginibacter sp.]
MRSKIYILLLLLCIAFNAAAQFTLQIEITATPSAHKQDGVFVAGSFNKWNPGDSMYRFHNENGKLVAIIKGLAADTYRFKFTRGSWQKVQSTNTGKDVDNQLLQLSADTTVSYTIDGWLDDYALPQKHQASTNVHVLDTAFFIPQLNRIRRIWIYLPHGYNQTKKHYPVMYLQDGQNLFDEVTSAYGEEWGVDECLDSIIAKGKQGCIVVGIDNGADTRMSEYNPYEFTWKDSTQSKTFLPEGNAYLDFLTQTLKPFIDKKYRTLTAKENTIIAGASMGGLIAYYAALKYPEVYGKAGVFSPAFWTAPEIKQLTDSVGKKVSSKFFFYCGGKESENMVEDMNEVAEKLGGNSHAMIYTAIDTEGRHDEKAWRKWFADFYVWMMADGYNNVIKLEQ